MDTFPRQQAVSAMLIVLAAFGSGLVGRDGDPADSQAAAAPIIAAAVEVDDCDGSPCRDPRAHRASRDLAQADGSRTNRSDCDPYRIDVAAGVQNRRTTCIDTQAVSTTAVAMALLRDVVDAPARIRVGLPAFRPGIVIGAR